MGQSISETVPKSTIAIAMLLWSVLFSLIAWLLVETIQNGKKLEYLSTIERVQEDHETRIRQLERTNDQRRP
jgi:hypothetical protein